MGRIMVQMLSNVNLFGLCNTYNIFQIFWHVFDIYTYSMYACIYMCVYVYEFDFMYFKRYYMRGLTALHRWIEPHFEN